MQAGDNSAMPSTHWSLIGRVQDGSTATRLTSLNDLLQCYLPALRAHLVWRKRLDNHFAEDVLQGFIADKVLERDLVATAQQDRGKFRSLLLRSLDNYTIDRIRRRRPDQRDGGGASGVQSFDEANSQPHATAADVFDLAWAQRVLVESLERMRDECRKSSHQRLWELFEDRVVAPALDPEARPVPYDESLVRYGFTSPQQVANLLVTAKRMFRRHLEATISEYVTQDEVTSEIEDLQLIVSTTGGQRLDLMQAVRPSGDNPSGIDSEFDLVDPQRFPAAFSEVSFGKLWSDAELSSILSHFLLQPLIELVPDIDKNQLTSPHASLADLLAHSAPALETLRRIKTYARSCARMPDSATMPPEIASVIYNTSIALALDRLGASITKSSTEVLCVSFQLFADAPWVSSEIRDLMTSCLSQLRNLEGQVR